MDPFQKQYHVGLYIRIAPPKRFGSFAFLVFDAFFAFRMIAIKPGYSLADKSSKEH
jgi:hypothetical protein